MATKHPIEKLALSTGTYYLVESDQVAELYKKAGFNEESDELPNFITVDGVECLFTENIVEKDGKEYEIVMVASGFSWEDIIIYEDDDSEA